MADLRGTFLFTIIPGGVSSKGSDALADPGRSAAQTPWVTSSAARSRPTSATFRETRLVRDRAQAVVATYEGGLVLPGASKDP